MTAPKIETPRGSITHNKSGKAVLKWNTDFQPKWQGRFTLAQKFVDSEVLRLSEPYIPLDTSMLIKSGILGTEIGSGTVKWIAPYAKAQYYSPRKPGSQTGALRGPYWFERMKKTYLRKILNGAKKLAGRA
ncbi:MAG: capsid protein [Desulfocapsa sp.]|nr:MAG: capsid protein [Desulfocapsa sp.]